MSLKPPPLTAAAEPGLHLVSDIEASRLVHRLNDGREKARRIHLHTIARKNRVENDGGNSVTALGEICDRGAHRRKQLRPHLVGGRARCVNRRNQRDVVTDRVIGAE